jgi:hypothetical protein
MRHRRGRQNTKRRKKKEKAEEISKDLNSIFGESPKKEVPKEKIEEVTEDLNSIFDEPPKKEVKPEKEPEIVYTETIRLTEEEKREILAGPTIPLKSDLELKLEKRAKTKAGRAFNFIKKHVRPDIGLGLSKKGEEPDFKNDDLHEIGNKIRKNLIVGLKLTIKF